MEAAPLHEDVAQAPSGGEAWWITASDGVRIRAANWAPEGKEAKGTVFLFTGRTEYIEKYGAVAGEYLARGYALLTCDWRGQGLADHALAEPLLGHVGDFAEFQRDVAAVVAHAERLQMPRPWFLVAHSMGGCIALRALHEGFPAKAVAFSAPMWGIQISPWKRPLAWLSSRLARWPAFAGRLAPGTTLEHTLLAAPFDSDENNLTTDRPTWDALKAQLEAHPELILGGPTLGWLRAAFDEMSALAKMPAPDMPAIAFLGTHERIVRPDRIRAGMAKWSRGELVIAQNGEHEIMMERPEIRDVFLDRSTALFDAHLNG